MGAYTHEVQLIGPLHETYLFIAIWAITFNIVQIYTPLWSFDYGHWGRISWRLDFIFAGSHLGVFFYPDRLTEKYQMHAQIKTIYIAIDCAIYHWTYND